MPEQNAAQETPEYVTPAEVAARVRTSKMTIYRLIKDGALPAARVGKSFRIRAAAVDTLLNEERAPE